MTSVDLTTCDQEPIHIPGAVQPHGALVVFDARDGRITHVSDSSATVLNQSPQELLGQPVETVFPSDEAAGRHAAIVAEATDAKPVYLFTVRVRKTDKSLDAIAHRNGDSIFLEFEPGQPDRARATGDSYRIVQSSIVRLQHARSLAEMFQTCAQRVRAISGFDRVMVYRFDADWNGEVVAEDRRDDLEPFLGLHYPASDIPKQARELYTKNWLRFIADRDYVPSPVLASAGTTAPPLDMSFSVLRSVSPIHLEYLRNMGVGASMSISLINDGVLWGLVACHHYSPRFVPYEIRTACELLGQFMSLQMRDAELREFAHVRDAARAATTRLLSHVEQREDVGQAVSSSVAAEDLLALVDAEGAAIVTGDRVERVGQTPGDEKILELSRLIASQPKTDVFATDDAEKLLSSALLNSVAAGVLSIALEGTSRATRIIWFRPEFVRTVDWAGDPAKSISKGDGVARLSPRGSFALWKQTVKGKSKPWSSVQIDAARSLRGGITQLVLRRAEQLASAHTDLRLASVEKEKLLDSERAARSEAERLGRMKDEFVATLSHELRTPLNAILGWAQVLASTGTMSEDIAQGVGVIERNARTQAQMIDDLLDISRIVSGKLRLDLQDTRLPAVVEAAISTIQLAAEAKNLRIERLIDPLPNVISTADPNRLQQAIWNLLSNAVKFTPKGGRIQVVLERVESHVELSVADTGQGIAPEFLPHVFDRYRQADASASRKHGGLGLGLAIVRNLVELHGGTVRAHSAGVGRGTTFVISLPLRILNDTLPGARVHPRGESSGDFDCDDVSLAGLRVLVIDDEPDARNLVSRFLTECEATVEVAGSAQQAIELIGQQSFDVIVSDIGMPGMDGFELLRRIRATEGAHKLPRTPAIALTAYARAEDRQRALLAGYQAHISKPVERGELLAQIASLSGRI